MKKYPIFIQDEQMACGAYCIYMILAYYHASANIHDIKNLSRLSKNGITIKGIIECFNAYDIESKAYEASINHIQEEVTLPCILHVIQGDLTHYIVLYEIKDDYCIVGDPAKGIEKMRRDELEAVYTNHMIAILHVGRVPEYKGQSYPQFLLETFLSYKTYILKLIYKGVLLAFLTYLGSIFFKIIIDDMNEKTHYFYMVLLCLSYGVIQLTSVGVNYKKSSEVIRLQRALDEDYVHESSVSMLNLHEQFFEQDKGYVQSMLISFYELSSMSIDMLTKIFLDGTTMICIFIGMYFISLKMSFIILIMYICVFICSSFYYKKIEHMNKNYIESFYTYQHHLLELISNYFLIKQFHLKRETEKRSFEYFDRNESYKQKQALTSSQYETIIHGIVYVFYILIMLIGFYLFKENELSMGEILMFYMLVSYSIEPMLSVITLFVQYEKILIIYDKYKAYQIEHKEKEQIIEKIRTITFENVSFAYGYTLPLFEHLDLTINKHTIIKGESGCGKTTLLKLMMGYDENYNGNIYFNHQELRKVDKSSLYQHVTYVDGEPTFLHTSLYDNFIYDKKEQITSLLTYFHHEELIEMFHIIISEDGAPLSLGQRQLVAFIRAILKDSDVYIFDESFSHMDSSLYQRVERYLKKIGEDKICVMVMHRMNAAKKGWDVITIDNSKKDVL